MKFLPKAIVAGLLSIAAISAFAAPTLTIHVVNQTGTTIRTQPNGIQPNVGYLKLLPDSIQNNQSADLVVQDLGSAKNPQFMGSYMLQVANGIIMDTLLLNFDAPTGSFAPVNIYSLKDNAPDWNPVLSSNYWDAVTSKTITYTITKK